LIRFLRKMKNSFRKKINEDIKAKDAGFRNFTSFVFVCYFGEKFSQRKCASIIGISHHKFRICLVERGWKTRNKKEAIRPKPKKRKMHLWRKVRENTPFIFPWCCIEVYYNKYLLTTYEIADEIGISQTSVIKLMKKYNITRRHQGEK